MADKKYIKVYNYARTPVILHGMNKDYVVEGTTSDERTSSENVLTDDVVYINDRSSVFRTGTLRFEDTEVEEMMEMLGNDNWRSTYITDPEIEDAILHPTYDAMLRILKTTNMGMIERYRGILVKIQTIGMQGVSEYVDYIIRERFRELGNGKIVSGIVLTPERFVSTAAEKQAADLQKENEALMKAVEALKKQLTENTPAVPDTNVETEVPTDEKPVATAKKTTSRKTTKKTEA